MLFVFIELKWFVIKLISLKYVRLIDSWSFWFEFQIYNARAGLKEFYFTKGF